MSKLMQLCKDYCKIKLVIKMRFEYFLNILLEKINTIELKFYENNISTQLIVKKPAEKITKNPNIDKRGHNLYN